MILIIDLCYREDSLSREEFVAPIERLLRKQPISRPRMGQSSAALR